MTDLMATRSASRHAAAIEVSDLHKSYGALEAVAGVSFAVAPERATPSERLAVRRGRH